MPGQTSYSVITKTDINDLKKPVQVLPPFSILETQKEQAQRPFSCTTLIGISGKLLLAN